MRKKKIRNKKAVLAFMAAVVIGLFLLRSVLLNRGVIRTPQPLEPAELQRQMNEYEVGINANGHAGRGTILQFTEPKKNQEAGTCYVVSACHLVKNGADGCEITFSDGTKAAGEVVALNEELDLGILKCSVNGQTSVWFSEDLMYQMQEGDPVYYLDQESLMSGSYISKDILLEETDTGLRRMAFAGENKNGMSGGGVYSSTGYYLGMIIAGSDSNEPAVICIPGNQVVDYFRENH